jgi:hypothetical protein
MRTEWTATRRRFQVDGLTLLVLDMSHLRERSRELRGLLISLRKGAIFAFRVRRQGGCELV